MNDLLNLKNKKILITGGLGHLGKFFVKSLIKLGSEVIICDQLSVVKYDIFLKDIENKFNKKIMYFQCDLSNESSRKILVKKIKLKIKNLDVLINCASLVGNSNLSGWNTNFENQSVSLWNKVMEINLIAAFDLSKNLKNLLSKNNGGVIINISSIYGSIAPDMNLYKNTNIYNPAAYSASKGGLNNLTKWLAVNLAPKIRVNSISPGGILRGQSKKFIKNYIKKTPLSRMANENDIVGAIIFLSSDLSKYVTGQNLIIDGGFTIH